MIHDRTQIKSHDGFGLHFQRWASESPVRGALALLHGQSDHSSRYDWLGQELAEAGYELHMIDLRGHGHSAGRRGHVWRIQGYLNDVMTLLAHSTRIAPNVKRFLGGHSLGALIALRYALEYSANLSGVICSALWLRLAFSPSVWKVSFAGLLSVLQPGLSMSNEFDPTHISTDRAVVEAYLNDPLVHGRITPRAYVTIARAQSYCLEHARQLRLPLLLMHGGDDRIAALSGSWDFYDAAPTGNKTLKHYEGMYHEIFYEPGKFDVVEDLIAWLAAH